MSIYSMLDHYAVQMQQTGAQGRAGDALLPTPARPPPVA